MKPLSLQETQLRALKLLNGELTLDEFMAIEKLDGELTLDEFIAAEKLVAANLIAGRDIHTPAESKSQEKQCLKGEVPAMGRDSFLVKPDEEKAMNNELTPVAPVTPAPVTPVTLVATAEVATPAATTTPAAPPAVNEDPVKAKMLAHLDVLTQIVENIDKMTKHTLDVTVDMQAELKALAKPITPAEKEKMAAADEKLKKMLAEFGGDMTVFQKALCNITGAGFVVGLVVPITFKHSVGLVLDIVSAVTNRATSIAVDTCKAQQGGYTWAQIRLNKDLREIFLQKKAPCNVIPIGG